MLIRCPECRHKVSAASAACPRCGLPLTPERINSAEPVDTVRDRRRIMDWIGGIGLIVVAICLLVVAHACIRSIDAQLNDPHRFDAIGEKLDEWERASTTPDTAHSGRVGED